MAISAVIFDFDGTLFFGTTEINYYTINMALEDMGLERIDRKTANGTVGDKLPAACARLLGPENVHRADELFDALLAHTPEAIRRHAHIEPACVSMLEKLSKRASLAICSNAEPEYLNTLINLFGIRRCFSCIWPSAAGYDKEKAIPEIKRILKADLAVMVGDRGEDVRSGSANGCVTVAIQNDYGARDAVGADFDVYDHAEMEKTLMHILNDMGGTAL